MDKSIISSTKEIHFSNPAAIVSFYKNQPKQNVIFDSSYSKMIGLNKIESDYVIPISKSEPKVQISRQNTSVRVIDPNAAIVNQAKENVKNDMEQTNPLPAVTKTNISTPAKRKKTSCSSTPKAKRPRHQRRQSIINGDIFALE